MFVFFVLMLLLLFFVLDDISVRVDVFCVFVFVVNVVINFLDKWYWWFVFIWVLFVLGCGWDVVVL